MEVGAGGGGGRENSRGFKIWEWGAGPDLSAGGRKWGLPIALVCCLSPGWPDARCPWLWGTLPGDEVIFFALVLVFFYFLSLV